MALNDENGTGMVMPVAPMGYGGGYGGGFGYPVAYPMMGGYGGGFGNGWGGDASWLILFIILAMGGWNNGGFGGFGGFGNDGAFPWLLNGQAGINSNTNAGFNQAATASTLSSIQNSITTGFSNAEVAACNRALDSQQTAYTNQIADLERSFAAQTAVTQGLTGLSSQFADCCCENRLGLANLTSTILSENCTDRAAISDGIRDLLTAGTANTQRILDTLCQDKIDAKNEKIQELQTQVTMQNLAASQAAQTAQLIADNNAQSQLLIQRIAPYPIPAYPVSNPYGCGGYGFGYGYNGFNNFGFNGFNPFGNVGFGNGSF